MDGDGDQHDRQRFPIPVVRELPKFWYRASLKKKLCCPNSDNHGFVTGVSVFPSFLGVDRNSLETGGEILHPRTVLVEIVQAKLGARAEVDTL